MRHDPIDPALFVAHRRRLVELLPPRSVAVVHAADILPTAGDGTLRLHPAADLFWLTGIEQEESVLVLAPQAVDPAHREILFIRQADEYSARWDGAKLDPDRARAISGIARVRSTTELPAALHALLADADGVYLNSNEHERAATEVEPRDLRFARRLIDRYPLHRHERLAPLLRRLRAVKDDAEVALIRHAIGITDAGLRRLCAALRPGVTEYELEAELLHEFTRRRSRPAFEPIVASGANACVLHYVDNMAACRAGDLVLVDVGAAWANYASDLTRCFPIDGRFTPRQRAIYEAVLRVLRGTIERTRPGVSLRDWKRAAQVQMADELVGLGLLTRDEAARDTPEEPACRRYFMHGVGHSLGLGVHDLAPLDGPLAPGWVMTVEPGIYVPEEGIGIRLENDLLVTNAGAIDLASDVPIEPDDVERMVRA